MRRIPFVGFFLLIVVSWGMFPLKAVSSEPVSLTLDKAVGLALEQSLSLQKSSIDLATSAYAASHLWSEIFPSISASTGLTYSSPLFTGDGFQVTPNALSYSISLGLSLSLNAGLSQVMKITRLAYQTRLLEYENARRQLEIQVIKTFYGLIADRENLLVLQESLDLAEMQREKNRIAFQNGLIGQLGYLQSQLGAETAKLALKRAQINYTSALGEFLGILGLDQTIETALEGTIEIFQIDVDPETLIQEHLAGRPDILTQRQTIERLEYEEKRVVRNARAPSVRLSTQWRGGSGNGGITGNFTDSLQGSITLDIPIDPWIPGTKTAQSIRSANANIEKAKLDLKNTENEARNKIRSLAANLRNSWAAIEVSRLQVEIAERTYQLAEQGFRQGAVEFLTLENNRKEMATTRQQLLANELAYEIMMLDLAAALNMDWKEFTGSTL